MAGAAPIAHPQPSGPFGPGRRADPAPCHARPAKAVELHNDASMSFSAADGVTRVAPRLVCLSFVASLVLRMSRFATCG